MHYEGTVIRPPSEANAIILQVTTGCSHNKCTFCGAYREKKFSIKDEAIVTADLQFAAKHCRQQKTLFIADGNALTMPYHALLDLFERIHSFLPQIRRISLYASSRDILQKSVSELSCLRQAGLGRIYMGLESGHEKTLKKINKGSDAETMIRAGARARRAGIFLSVTCLLGIAGIRYSMAHAADTAAALNTMEPHQIAILTLMLLKNTELGEDAEKGRFHLPDKLGLFQELRTLISHLDVQRCQLQANHASNYFSLNGRLPRDKDNFLEIIDQAIAGTLHLKPEPFRGL